MTEAATVSLCCRRVQTGAPVAYTNHAPCSRSLLPPVSNRLEVHSRVTERLGILSHLLRPILRVRAMCSNKGCDLRSKEAQRTAKRASNGLGTSERSMWGHHITLRTPRSLPLQHANGRS